MQEKNKTYPPDAPDAPVLLDTRTAPFCCRTIDRMAGRPMPWPFLKKRKNESRGVRCVLHATKWHTWCGQKTKKMVATTTLPTCTHDGVGNCIGQQEVPTFWWWKRVQTNSPWHPHWNQGHRPWFETSPLIKQTVVKIKKIIGGRKNSWIETMINGRKSKNNG